MSTNANPSATITLNIATFNGINTGTFCTLSGVQVVSSGGASVSANPLPPYTVRTVQPAGQPLALTFQATGPQPAAGQGSAVYSVEAVYFSGSGQGSVFSSPSENNGTVTVTDTPTASRPTGKGEYLAVVKRTVTDSTGTITWVSVGVIDPPIDNEPGK